MSGALTQAIQESVAGTLDRYGELFVDDARAMLDADGRNATGDVRDELYAVVTEEGDAVVLDFGSSSGHARWAHEGREPGTPPPVAPIQAWVEVKLGVPVEENRGIAYVIARKIGDEGTEGSPFLTQPLEERSAALMQDLAASSAQGLALGIELRFGAADRYDVGSTRLNFGGAR